MIQQLTKLSEEIWIILAKSFIIYYNLFYLLIEQFYMSFWAMVRNKYNCCMDFLVVLENSVHLRGIESVLGCPYVTAWIWGSLKEVVAPLPEILLDDTVGHRGWLLSDTTRRLTTLRAVHSKPQTTSKNLK